MAVSWLIVESKGMRVIFSERLQKNVTKGQRRAKYLKIWAKLYKKGHVIARDYRTQ